MTRPGFEIDGRAHRLALKLLGDRVAKRIGRKAVTAGAKPIVKATKDGAPRESGLTAKAIGRKVKSFSDGNAYAIIGARREIAGEYKGQRRVPANYLHLVELGHIAPDGSFVPGNPFVKRANEQARAAAQSIVRSTLDTEIRKEAARL